MSAPQVIGVDLAPCELIIEAAPERLELEQELFCGVVADRGAAVLERGLAGEVLALTLLASGTL